MMMILLHKTEQKETMALEDVAAKVIGFTSKPKSEGLDTIE